MSSRYLPDSKNTQQPIHEWLDETAPDFEEATLILVRGILNNDMTERDRESLAEYIQEFHDEPGHDDPMRDGWVGSDGRP